MASNQAELPQACSQAAFARRLGYRRSYVTALKAAGRLVLSDDGQVLVAESMARIEATRDPGKAAVAERHAAARTAPQAPEANQPAPPRADQAAESESAVGYQHWRERRERAGALAAERENALAEGKLLPAADVAAQVTTAFVIARGALEGLPDILAPQLAAESDESRCRALLVDAVELHLADLSRRLSTLGGTP
jgi:hypothetical protein